MVRSVLSVLAGIAVLTAASFAIEAAVDPLLLWVFPQALPSPKALSANQWVRKLTFAYGFLCVAAGGYIVRIEVIGVKGSTVVIRKIGVLN